ncbi:MAG: GtrA family protein [Bacteroidales bacterium]|nr:GtrA family protein [Bacteroidales bacterium]
MTRKRDFVKENVSAIIAWFYIPFRKFIPPETFRYAATGGANLTLDIFLYFVVYNFILKKEILDLGPLAVSPHIAAFLIVFPITFFTGFLLAKYITFTESPLRGRIQLVRYAISVGGSILLNYFLLKFFVEILHFWPTVSKMFTAVFVVTYSYLIQRYFTFQTGEIIKRKNKKTGK